MSNSVIKTHLLTKVYGTKRVVDNVSMDVRKGDIYGFIGSNGAGKTTFIRMVMGLIKPSGGSIELFGSSDSDALIKLRAKIGCIVETPSLMLNMNAHDCLKTQALLYGVYSKQQIDELLDTVGLANTLQKRVKDFSLGMKQRLAIAQALVNNPDLLILDEPTNGMDPQGIVEMRNFLHHLCREKGMTILISSHILSELEQLATRFGIISNGALIDEFSKDELGVKSASKSVISVDNIELALSLITQNMPSLNYTVDGNKITLPTEDYKNVNKLLVLSDLNVVFVDKQNNLEDYFIKKVGG